MAHTTSAAQVAPITWADGFGVWHVRVARWFLAHSSAVAALRDELGAREGLDNIARDVWAEPVVVVAMCDEGTVVYRERLDSERDDD